MIIKFNGTWQRHCPRVSLCDAQIDRITFSENYVRFYFTNGFWVQNDEMLFSKRSGYVEFPNCDVDDFFCMIVTRRPTKHGAKMYGKPLSLMELSNMLARKKRSVEVFLELYDWNYLHWRGSLHPNKKRILSNWVAIELSDCFPINFCWE